MKIIKPPAAVLKQGSAFHAGIEHNYAQKIRTHKDVAEKEVLEYYDSAFESEWSREEVKLEEGETKGGLKDQGVELVKVFHADIAPLVQPVEVEDKFDYTFTPKADDGGGADQSVHLTGRIDVIDDRGIIRDNKSMGRKPSPDELATDLQLSIYSLARRMKTRKVETELTLDAVLKYARPKAEILRTKRSREMLEMTRNTIGMVSKGIINEVFPRHSNGWWCSKKWCGYWDDCMGKAIVQVDMAENLEPKLKESVAREERQAEDDRKESREKGGKKAAQSGQKGLQEARRATDKSAG